jgi:serine/threonine protein kinase
MRECPRCERCYDDEVLVCPEEGNNTKHTLPGGTLLSDRYLLEKRLGRGAMGQVYLARDQNLVTRRVAVKTVRPDILSDEDMQEGEAIARFEREARTAASIRHPNVVDVTDFGKTKEGVFFLVMEYVQGETMYHLLRREGTLSVQRTLALLRQVVAGVEAAHDEGILHRDLKPANIFIMQKRKKSGSMASSGDGFVKVGDFGLAKIVSEAAAEAISSSGPASRGIIGTPEYMAPEQMQPTAKLDARADVYALGIIAYHMLGGRPPFTGDLTQLITQKLMDAPPPLSNLRSDISVEVQRAVMHALERDPAARPATVADWLEEFETAAGEESADDDSGDSRVVVLAPTGAEVYVDDERHGSVGRSGRLVLSAIAPGRHVLRVSQTGSNDDERVIEIRPDSSEQIIQANLRTEGRPGNPISPSRGGSLGEASHTGSVPGVVVCAQCSARFAAGVKFCGRCGGTIFHSVEGQQGAGNIGSGGLGGSGAHPVSGIRCPRCGVAYPHGTKFCGRCGMTINAPATPASYMPSIKPPTIKPPTARPAGLEAICLSCHTSYPAGTKFCGRCGSVI